MKKNLLIALLATMLVVSTGCGKKETQKENNNSNDVNEEQTVVEDQIFEGLEFVNVGAKEGIITTIVINNTGVKYEGSKFSIKIMDENGNTVVEEIDEVKEPMETGTTKEIKTKTKVDLSKAASVEYSVISK